MDLKKGDSVVMINCGEAEHYAGKVWTCKDDSFKDVNQQEVVFLEGFSGYFHCRFLVKPYKEDRDMPCKCLEEIPKKIKAHCNEQKEYQVNPVEDVIFKDVVFLTHDFGLHAVLKADMALQIEGRKTPKKTTMTFVYCPFCGVKYQEDV